MLVYRMPSLIKRLEMSVNVSLKCKKSLKCAFYSGQNILYSSWKLWTFKLFGSCTGLLGLKNCPKLGESSIPLVEISSKCKQFKR